MPFDIYFLPINIAQGKEQADLPGLFVAEAPKRTARGRDNDVLILFISLLGDVARLHTSLEEIFLVLTDTYYNTPGSVTSGLQAVIRQLNELLLGINLHNKEDEQILGKLNLAVIRRDLLFLAQGGSTHTYLLFKENVIDNFDPNSTPRALGLGRSVTPRFTQQQIQTGSLYLFCAEPPEAWIANVLISGMQFSLEGLRRRLVHRTQANAQAVIIQFSPGNGEIHYLRRRSTTSMTNESSAVVMPQSDVEARRETEVFEDRQDIRNVSPTLESGMPERLKVETVDSLHIKKTHIISGMTIRKRLGQIWMKCKAVRQRTNECFRVLLVRILPGVSDKPLTISPGLMYFIALAVPLAVVAIATTLYFRNGRAEEHQRYLNIALNTAVQAQGAPDINLQKEIWKDTLMWLDKAEKYGQSEESVALRSFINQTLDEIDGITRVDAFPSNKESFLESIKITQMAAIGTDVYVLDSIEGRVWRLFLTGNGYNVDPEFECGPGPYGSTMINPLIDIVSLPPFNPLRATIMAIDDKGNLLYCIPDEKPSAGSLITPYTDWNMIIAFSLRMNSLYVLDRGSNAVWKYEGTDFSFLDEPVQYFENIIPQKLDEVIDLAVTDDELFLLRENGTIISCIYNPLTKETCTDPSPFGDLRPGRDQQPLSFPGASFTHIQSTTPPDPSLFMLDANQIAVYQFSLRLNLNRLLVPRFSNDFPVPNQPPTAFVVTPNKILVMAFNNILFYATIP